MSTCRMCKGEVKGRSDKIFCSAKCKAYYHKRLKEVNALATQRIDAILHRNRAILLEIMGKNINQKKVSRKMLDDKKFNFNYITNHHTNVRGKLVSYVYDFSWIIFSDQEVLIKRIRTNREKIYY